MGFDSMVQDFEGAVYEPSSAAHLVAKNSAEVKAPDTLSTMAFCRESIADVVMVTASRDTTTRMPVCRPPSTLSSRLNKIVLPVSQSPLRNGSRLEGTAHRCQHTHHICWAQDPPIPMTPVHHHPCEMVDWHHVFVQL